MNILPLNRTQILAWLRENAPDHLGELWQRADQVRLENVGDDVHLRGLIELSNICVRQCSYCGLRASNHDITRYRMTADEVIDSARRAVQFGYGTVVLQSGEDPGLTREMITGLIKSIKSNTPLAVTLSLGERADDELVEWHEAGADRYLLRFETSNRTLFDAIHPPKDGHYCDRLAILEKLRKIGYEVGSGVMIGIPGQSYDDLADDIEAFGRLDLDMIGVGPFLEHPQTPLADPAQRPRVENEEDQVPPTELMTYKVIALARLMCPKANIPATTALATLNKTHGRELGLSRGANIVMPNITPLKYRIHYEIYPAKACIQETAEACNTCLSTRIAAIGRNVGQGQGGSKNYRDRTTAN